MNSNLLLHAGTRKRRAPAQDFLGDLTLTRARVHEFCGLSRRTLALMLAARTDGPIFWISPSWETDRLHGEGICRFIDPARLIFFTPTRSEDLLWVMEEALRSGIVPLVIADLPAPPALTPVRRLHLAAETGMAEAGRAPLGVLLTGVAGGAPGVESRWSLRPAHRADRIAWLLSRQRARTAPPQSWRLRPDGAGFHISPFTPAAQDHETVSPKSRASG